MLTKKQQELLDFLQNNQERFDYPPSLMELCTALELKSKGSLLKRINPLIAAGYIEPISQKQRGVRLSNKGKTLNPNQPNSLQYVGVIAAGKPIEALENIQYITVPEELQSELPCYVLKVKGESMKDEGILNGDWVIIEQRSYARNGEIVVALIDGSEATLKYIEQYPHETLLIPANSAMTTMRYHPSQIQIQGVLVGQMRSYRTRQPK